MLNISAPKTAKRKRGLSKRATTGPVALTVGIPQEVGSNITVSSVGMALQFSKEKRLVIPVKSVSWNRIVCHHWRTYKRLKDELKVSALEAFNKSPLSKVDGPVNIEIDAYFKDGRRHDGDNVFAKPILDFLVEKGVLVDDDCDYVKSTTYRAHKRAEKDMITLTIIPV